ncbi:hypothetical protein P280DRAFT_464323 [Massarina eburnea CBS 473.64]|uniref:Uncharacterized protein n=1 Tax=Massarina eburnea CBS 473.64 TaxID=1395130 RepID=A0A6A6SDZ0_9PLEO|nr:hypothetical protein P280DRAFT_464323 [Massarina eburnea CBS 473.64]
MAPPRLTDLSRHIRQDIFHRLRWNTLDALDNIEITTKRHGEEAFEPLFDSPYANESMAQPPLSHVKVRVAELLSKQTYDFQYEPPPELSIDNHDDSPITMKQFVTEVHAYLSKNIDEIKTAKGDLYGEMVTLEDGRTFRQIVYGRPYLPPDIGIFFRRIFACESDGDVKIRVFLYAEGESARPVDTFWSLRLRDAHTAEQERQGY